MIQTVILSTVLLVAAGPNLALFCRTWCHDSGSPVNECHHANSYDTQEMNGSVDCEKALGGAAAVLSEDVRLGVPSADAHQAIRVSGHQLPPLAPAAQPGHEPWRESSLDTRPLSIALRI